jgi:hypothetical protein
MDLERDLEEGSRALRRQWVEMEQAVELLKRTQLECDAKSAEATRLFEENMRRMEALIARLERRS